MSSSTLETKFATLWKVHDGPELQSEYKFHASRKWRFDYCHSLTKVAVELEGGVWSGGRHTRPTGFIKDAEKYNYAANADWLVFRLPDKFINSEWVTRIIEKIKDKERRYYASSKTSEN